MSPVALSTDKQGVLIPVRVRPRGQHNVVTGTRGTALWVTVTAPPVGGAANAAVVKTVAAALCCPPGGITLAHGLKSRDKVLRVGGLSLAQVAERLQAVLGHRGVNSPGD